MNDFASDPLDGDPVETILDDTSPDYPFEYGDWSEPDPVSPTFPESGAANPRAPALHKAPAEAGAWITRRGYSWGTVAGTPSTVTYAYRASAPAYGTSGSNVAGTFSTFSAAQIAAAQSILDLWSDVANIRFVRVGTGSSGAGAYSNAASILLGDYRDGSDGAAAFAYFPAASATAAGSSAGDLWDNQYWSYNASPAIGNYGWLTLIHELGHAIGLEHPGDYNAAPGVSITYENNAVYFEDSRQYSVMSYFGASNTGGNHGAYYAATPLLDDITAVQRLYGANLLTRTGNTVYGFNSNADRTAYQLTSASDQRVETIYDAGGIDTLDVSGYATNQVISLNAGTFSSTGALTGNLSIALGTVIENAIGGSGNDTFYGNAADNVIDGRGGSDTVVYTGSRAEYLASRDASGLVLADSRAGRDGTDHLLGIEFVQFADQRASASSLGQPALPSAVVAFNDATQGISGTAAMEAAAPGSPGYLDWQFIYSGGDSLAVATSAPNAFIHTGSGNDAIQSGEGSNVLDGGLGSNFLTGGSGTDTFFTDARGSGVVWNTVRNFGAGDAATLWGYAEGVSSWRWDAALAGAPGSQGATLRANIVGGAGRTGDGIDASITFAGLSVAQARNLQFATGTQAAGSYLYLYNPGV